MRLASLSMLFVAAALFGGCRCGETPERAWEVGAALEELPRARPTTLAELVPSPAPIYFETRSAARLLAELRASPRLAAFSSDAVLSQLSRSKSAARLKALRQQLTELSRAPLAELGLDALLDGPAALAFRRGGEGLDLLLVKRLSPAASAGWRLAGMMQGVHPSQREVRVERYRGLPLRKVFLDDRRRLTYFVLQDVLVVGTSDAWVKASLDRALASTGGSAADQRPIRAALATIGEALGFAVVDADALRAEPGPPDLMTLALAQASWLRLTVQPGRPIQLTLAQPNAQAPSPPELVRFAPRETLAAFSRSLDARALAAELLSRLPVDAKEDAKRLQARLTGELVPHLGGQLFWYTDGLAGQERANRHVLGIGLSEPRRVREALPSLAASLLSPPVKVERAEDHELACGGPGPALCAAVAGSTLLLSNQRSALVTALAVFQHRAPGARWPTTTPGTALLVRLDGETLAAALGAAPPPPSDAASAADKPRLDALVSAMRAVGAVAAVLGPDKPGTYTGEVSPL